MARPRLTAQALQGLRVALHTCPDPPRTAPPGHYGPDDRAELAAAFRWLKAMEAWQTPRPSS